MTILVVGASGATGQLLVKQLLERGQEVKAIVRSAQKLPINLRNHQRLSIVEASLLDLGDTEMMQLISDCEAVASCLGHPLSLKGIYGSPRALVADATRRLCAAITATQPARPVRFLLMSTAGNSNRDLDKPIPLGERCLLGLIRLLVPPHLDHEKATAYLRNHVTDGSVVDGSGGAIEWIAVRPDTLVDKDSVTQYEVHASPTRSAILNPGKTSRINVAHFMAELLLNDAAWERWKGQMPVIYDKGCA